jgi:predicted DNA-binding protein (UPF0251 family)
MARDMTQTNRSRAAAKKRVGVDYETFWQQCADRDLTQGEAAAMLGVSRQTAHKWLHEDGWTTRKYQTWVRTTD